jgi:hypothetical protein
VIGPEAVIVRRAWEAPEQTEQRARDAMQLPAHTLRFEYSPHGVFLIAQFDNGMQLQALVRGVIWTSADAVN